MMDTSRLAARCCARNRRARPLWAAAISSARSIQKVVSVSIGAALPGLYPSQRFHVRKEGALETLQVLLQITEGADRRRRQPLDYIAETFRALFVLLQRRICFVAEHHIFAHIQTL